MPVFEHNRKVIPVGFADISQFINLTGDNDPLAITYGIDISAGPFTQPDLAECRNAYVTGFLNFMPPFYSVGSIRAVVGVDAGDPVVIESGGTDPGTDTATGHLPQNCALLVTKRTASGGRRNRGRMYIPGLLGDAAVDNLGNLMSGIETTYQGSADAFLSALTDSGVTNVASMVILHTYGWNGGVDPGLPVGFPAPTPVTSLDVQGTIGTQRRRLRR